MTKLWSIDVRIAATAYIKAETAEQAMEVARNLGDLELIEQGGDPPISGKQFDDPDLPEVSLSPAMSMHGPREGQVPQEVEA